MCPRSRSRTRSVNQPLENPRIPIAATLGDVTKFSDLQNELRKNKADIGKLILYLQTTFQGIVNQLNTQVQSVGKDLSGTLVQPTNPIHHVTGTATISTINAPRGFTGPLMLISDDGFSFDATGNIATFGNVPAGNSQFFVYDGTEWHPQANATNIGPITYKVVNISANYNVDADDVYIFADATIAPFNVTLPPVALERGRFVEVVNIGAANDVSVFGDGAETINGSNSQLVAPSNGLPVVTDGTEWRIV